MNDLTQKHALMLRKMTIREKIGQTVNILANMNDIEKRHGSLEAFFEKYPVGGLYIGAQAWLNPEKTYGKEWFIRANEEYQRISKYPLLIMEDMENGPGFLLPDMPMLPHLMALGASRSEELAYEYGKAIAYGAHSLGIHWLLNPVADININPFSPGVNVRAISDDPELVTRLLVQVVKGIEDNGVAACLKHFPGDGVDFREQHAVTNYNSLSQKDWDNSFGMVYRECIKAGVSSVMTGHIALPSYQTQKIDGRYPPATLSKELSTDLLRKKTGFDRVVVTDAVVMGGFKKHINDHTQAEIESFKAGSDVILWPALNYFDRMEQAIEKGEISMARLDESVARILELKEKKGVLEQKEKYTPFNEEKKIYIKTVSQAIADKSLTLVRDEINFLPLCNTKIKTALIVGIAPNDMHYKNMETIKEEFEKRGVQTKLQRNIDYEANGWKDTFSHENDVIILALARFPQRPFGAMNFMAPEFFSLWGGLSHGRDKTIVASFGSPYHLNEHFEASKIYINAYSFVKQSMIAFVKAVFGEIPFEGKSPVKLELDNWG
jgi:beta-N-acetylhexosaminidase